MGRLRIRWGWLARGAGAFLAGLVALQVLPGLLAPPTVPPLAADVGLSGVARTDRPHTVIPERGAREPRPEPERTPKPRPSHGIAAATAVIGTTPRRHRPQPPPPVSTPPPEPVPVTPTPAPPPAPEDGSLEFAPR